MIKTLDFDPLIVKKSEELSKSEILNRFWKKDPSLWKSDTQDQSQISNSLGWLTVVDWMETKLPEILDFAKEVKSKGFKDVVLLGMGGSSLAAELFRTAIPPLEGYPTLHVLDSTDPDWIDSLECSVHIDKTLFIYASKSGSTIEPASFFNYFFDKTSKRGEQFIAITDPSTPLESFAKENKFLKTFINPKDIGGRFSALSYFGILPAALGGIEISRILKSAKAMVDQSKNSVLQENPSFTLGILLAEAYALGKDKVTILLPPSYKTLGLWIEQLIAESSGKEGKGLVPIVGEELDDPKNYGADRIFIEIREKSQKSWIEGEVWNQIKESHPTYTIEIAGPYDLGGEFIRWEIATAVACSLMGVNAFDQPDVQLAKDQTKSLLSKIVKEGGLKLKKPFIENDDFQLRLSKELEGNIPSDIKDPALIIKKILESCRPNQYIGLLAYCPNDSETESQLFTLRKNLQIRTGLATLFGYGPRYLHSTGQLHKGGPNNGIYFLITKESKKPIPIPGEKYSFEELELAQGVGDFQALENRSRAVVHFHLKAPFQKSLAALIPILRP